MESIQEQGPLLRLYAKCLWLWVEKVYKDLIPVTAIGVDRKFTVGAVRLRPPPPHPLSLAQECMSYADWQGWAIFIY